MRKGQDKLLKSENKANMVISEISILSREDLTLNEIEGYAKTMRY